MFDKFFYIESSFTGGRFKKEVVIDGQSYLLLIRDEGNSLPDYQVRFLFSFTKYFHFISYYFNFLIF